MAGRPYWSGQLKISLVSFGIQLFPATTSESGVTFHQIDRKTGQRVRHMNVIGEREPVENAEIVKGYEYTKGKYLVVEPDEISKLRLETRDVIEVRQFVDLAEIQPALFEKPYFVVPEPRESPDAFAVVREAMAQAGKAAIGEITFAGREHLVAIAVPPQESARGLMAYTLRYAEEMRKSEEYFSGIAASRAEIDNKQLSMAAQLVEAYSHPFHLDAYKDDYESALRELIEAKQKNVPLPVEVKERRPAKVINLMDALKQSVSQGKRPVASERNVRNAPARTSQRNGPVAVEAGKRKHRAA